MKLSSRIRLLWREIRLFLYYCSPCILSLAVVIVTNFQRVKDVQRVVVKQACQQLDQQTTANESTPVTPGQLEKIVKVIKANGWNSCAENPSSASNRFTVPEYIDSYFLTAWSANSIAVTILTLLPFGILGLGLALKYRGAARSSTHGDEHSEVIKKDQYLSYRKISFKDFVLKCLVAFVIGVGWLYLFNPHGQAASAINDWLRNTDVMANDTAPNFFNFKDSSIKHVLAAVLGWYLYLLGYFSYRFYKSDVLGTRVYNVLFKKFLFVIGVAFIVSASGATSNESLILVFLIGFFPLSAVTLLTEFGNKRLSAGEDQTSLSILPGLSTWQVLRLEEEGIDSISALANSNPEVLKSVISSEVMGPAMLDTWIDQARLISVIGTKRWTDLNGICERASEFVTKENNKDPGFIAKLAEKNFFNPDEISRTLQSNFGIVPARS